MSKNKARDAYRLLAAAQNCATSKGRDALEEVQIHTDGYAEPGYRGDVVATGNWNTISKWDEAAHKFVDIDDMPARLGHALEKIGVEIEWSDEWSTCDKCNKLVRTSANSYSWQPSFTFDDGGITCCGCLKEDPEAYLESLEGNERNFGY